MAQPEQIELSDFIKSVHRSLRESSKCLGPETAWETHCADERQLEKYSQAMQALAKNYWDKNCRKINRPSRVDWTHQMCLSYYHKNAIMKWREKEIQIAKLHNFPVPQCSEKFPSKIELLDVGSCYNPFSHFEEYSTLAIDLAPANEQVLKCDFLKVELGSSTIINKSSVLSIQKDYFDVVLFSLLLEYLPGPEQRYDCCLKAYDILKFEGLLLIITPDSKHVGANSKIMKSWRYILADLGFSRISYEKLRHTHCMAFRKCLNPLIPRRWAQIYKQDGLYEKIFIPQDLQEKPTEIIKSGSTYFNSEKDSLDCFQELPYCDTDE